MSSVKALLDDDETPSNRKIAESTGFSKSQVSHWLKTAKGEGYVIDANDGQRGKSADLSVGAELPADTDLLPTVNALTERYESLHNTSSDDPTPAGVPVESGRGNAASVDAFAAALEDIHQLAERCYSYQYKYAIDHECDDPETFATIETRRFYAAVMVRLRNDGLRGLARDLRDHLDSDGLGPM